MARYPLEPLVQIRAADVDGAAQAFARAIAERERAESLADEARREEQRFLDEATAVEQREALALASGVLRASDLAQRDAYLAGAARVARENAEAVARAESLVDVARETEERARAELAERKAQAKILENDRQRFVERARHAADVKEDDNVEEMVAARRHDS